MVLRNSLSAIVVLSLTGGPVLAQAGPDAGSFDFSRSHSSGANNAPPPVYTVGEPPAPSPSAYGTAGQSADGSAAPGSVAAPPEGVSSGASPAAPGSSWQSDLGRGAHWSGSLVGQHTIGGAESSSGTSYQPPSYYGQGGYSYGQGSAGAGRGASQWSLTSGAAGSGPSSYSSRMTQGSGAAANPSPSTSAAGDAPATPAK